MQDLFPVENTPSPKIQWLRKHRLATRPEHLGWQCHNGGYTLTGYGDSEEEAILDYCIRHNLKHWTLE